MSGGELMDYQQYKFLEGIERIQLELDRQGKPREGLSRWEDENLSEEDKHYPVYSEEVQLLFNTAKYQMKMAYIYAQRIDWFLSGDDSEDSMFERLAKEKDKLEKEIEESAQVILKQFEK